MQTPRRARRIKVLVETILEAGGRHYFAETADLSEIGLFLLTKKAFPIGTQLRMVFGQPPSLPRVDVEGIVVWEKRGEGVGIEFKKLTVRDQENIRAFLSAKEN